jgi:hypothetical protein
MKNPPPVASGGGRRPEITSSSSSLPSRPRPVHPIDQPDRPISADSDLGDIGDLDPDRPTPAESDLDDPDFEPGGNNSDFDLEDDAELRPLFAERGERPGVQTYLTGPTSTFEDGRYERALAALTTLIPSAEIIDARSLFCDLHEYGERRPSLPYGIDRLVFITADDGTIGWGVYGDVYDAQESLPVHLLDLDTIELVPAQELHLVSTAHVLRGKAGWTCSHYVLRSWPFELIMLVAQFLRAVKPFRRVA